MKILSYQADHELVVVRVQAVAGKPHVVRQILLPIESANSSMFPQDALLNVLRLRVEGSGSAEWIPDAPRPFRIEDGATGPLKQPFLQVRFIATGIAPTQHGELGSQRQRAEGLLVEQFANRGCESCGGPHPWSGVHTPGGG